MTRQSIIAAAGGATGWLATWFAKVTLSEAATGFAGLCTGIWMLSQAYVLLRRQRCTDYRCQNRQP